MKDNRLPIEYEEGKLYLFDSAYRTMPYSIITALLLALYLYLNKGPKELIIMWLASMIAIIAIRMLHCKFVISKNILNDSFKFHLSLFVLLTFISGLVITSIYFLAIPYISGTPKDIIIILSFCVIIAGTVTSLGVYYPAYYVYVMSIYMPIVIYHYYLGGLNHIIFATIVFLYVLGLTKVTKVHRNILKEIFFLTEQNKELLDKFEELSVTDALTGLYNRRQFTKIIQDEYNTTKRNKQAFVLISIDVDNFKLINDNFGHPFGDSFLMYTADYLKNYLTPVNGMIFRLGGDEFAALVVNITEEKTQELCNEIKNHFIKNPKFDYDVQSHDYQKILEHVSLSIGVVYIPYHSASNMEYIIEEADQLLYQAKTQGKNEIKYTKIK